MARRDEGPGTRQTRLRVAQEAARLLAEHGGDDLVWARRKAAARFGIRDEAALPGSEEILAALRSHRELFGRPDTVAAPSLRKLREAALEAMEFFAALEPRLVGAVLTGELDGEAPVRLHLHADDPDAVEHLLLDRRIPARQKTRRLRLEGQRGSDVPTWAFEADGIAFELLQLPLSSLRQPPRDELNERPMQRASIAAVRRLLEDSPEDSGA